MIKLKIEKDGSKETLDWANLKLTDSEGNEYSRMDDEFISEAWYDTYGRNHFEFRF